jgi:EAL and modified HD-GYP domain-containing signal transduction protein
MNASVLGSVSLGYQPLWNRHRALAAVQLSIETLPDIAPDAGLLLAALQELDNASTPPLLLSPKSPQLLRDLLEHAPATRHWLEVRGDWLQAPAISDRIQRAHQRGLRLVWRGEADILPSGAMARCFFTHLLFLSPQAALTALQTAARKRAGAQIALHSPVQAGQIYEGIASRLLMEHCLDQQNATALLGWPDEDILYALQHKATGADRQSVLQMIHAVDEDRSIEHIESLLCAEPILTFRFLAYANSASVGLRNTIESVRHGLMMLGLQTLRRWLYETLPSASSDLNLRPVKAAIVLRAKLMEHLMDAGAEQELSREIYLCGLFSQIDVLMGEPLGTALHRVPLSSRIYAATLHGSGPYAPLLQIASALENGHGTATRALCHQLGMPLEDVNRALLRTLAALKSETP